MDHGGRVSTWAAMLLVVLVWPAFFAGLWCLITLSMSRLGGWHRLARTYRAAQVPEGGRKVGGVTGMVGMARYKRALTLTFVEDGLYLEPRRVFRIGHPPLFIPWRDIRNARRLALFYRDYVGFDVGEPRIASLRLPAELLLEAPIAIARS